MEPWLASAGGTSDGIFKYQLVANLPVSQPVKEF